MNRPRMWTDNEIAQLIKLRSGGLSADEIAKALNRTPGSIWGKLTDLDGRKNRKREGLEVGLTAEDRHFANDAIMGSAQLRDEIIRVFGRAA